MTLADLERVRWDELEDARGEAPVEVPDALRILASSKKATERKSAYSDLYEILTHDGDYLHPIAFAVAPFLFELLESDLTPDRGAILTLLLECACGGSHRRFVARGGYDGSADDIASEGQSVRDLRVRLAAATTIQALLAHKSKKTRAVAAHAVGFLPEVPKAADLLLARLRIENDDVVTAQIILALGRLRAWNEADVTVKASSALVEWARSFARAHQHPNDVTRAEALDLLTQANALEVSLPTSLAPKTATAKYLANVAYGRGDADLLLALAEARAVDPATLIGGAFTLAFPPRDGTAPPVLRDELSPRQSDLLRAMGRLVAEFTHAVPHIEELGARGVVSETHFRRLAQIEDGAAETKAANDKPHWFNAWALLYAGAPQETFVSSLADHQGRFAITRDVAAYELLSGWPPDYSAPSARQRPVSEAFGRALRDIYAGADAETLRRETEIELARAGRHQTLPAMTAAAVAKNIELSDRLERRLPDMVVMGDYESIAALLHALPVLRRESALVAIGFDETVRAEKGSTVVDFDGAWPFLACARTGVVLDSLLSHLRTWNWDVLQLLRARDSTAKTFIESFVVRELAAFGDAARLQTTAESWKNDPQLDPQRTLLQRALGNRLVE